MKSYIFQINVEEDRFEDGRKAYHASCPALKGGHTWEHTYEEVLANIKEAVELYIADLRESGEQIPSDPDRGVLEWPTPSVAVNL